MFKNRKLILLMATFLILLTACAESDIESIDDNEEIAIIESMRLYDENKELFSTDDNRIVDEVFAILDETIQLDKPNEKIDGLEVYVEMTDTKGNKTNYKLTGNYLYRQAMIEHSGTMIKMGYDDFRYFRALVDYVKYIDLDFEFDVVQLFNEYDWIVDFRIDKFKKVLPETFIYESGEYPIKLYWSYNNELSKKIGLDFTSYAGKEVEIEMYRLRESIPDTGNPNRDARGIIIRYEGKIIGAYVDRTRAGFGCSLNKEFIDLDFSNWINTENKNEIFLSEKTPEEIIKLYYRALSDHDEKSILGLLAKRKLIDVLHYNIDQIDLYKDSFTFSDNIVSAKIVSIEKWENAPGEYLEYAVELDMDYVKQITGNENDGMHIYFVVLDEEIKGLGYRIISIGTGP